MVDLDANFWDHYIRDVIKIARLGKRYRDDIAKGIPQEKIDGAIIKGIIEGMELVICAYLINEEFSKRRSYIS